MPLFHSGQWRTSDTGFMLAALECLLVLIVGTALVFGAGRTMLGDGVILVWLALAPVAILSAQHWIAAADIRTEENEFEALLQREAYRGE